MARIDELRKSGEESFLNYDHEYSQGLKAMVRRGECHSAFVGDFDLDEAAERIKRGLKPYRLPHDPDEPHEYYVPSDPQEASEPGDPAGSSGLSDLHESDETSDLPEQRESYELRETDGPLVEAGAQGEAKADLGSSTGAAVSENLNLREEGSSASESTNLPEIALANERFACEVFEDDLSIYDDPGD